MRKTFTAVLLVLGIIIFANLVGKQYFFRIDFTEDDRYTMSGATLDILKELEDPITVKAYFSENLPADFSKVRKEFKDFLVEYSRLSGGDIVYKFINPGEDEKTENEAVQAGVRPVMINVREKNQVKQQKAFLGAVLELDDQKEVIPFIHPNTSLEYALTTAIKKIIVKEKPPIAFIQGHGEPTLSEMFQVVKGLGVLYDTQELDLPNTETIPDKYKTAVIIRPKDSISEGDMDKIDSFLNRGGHLFVALNRVDGDLNKGMGSSLSTGLENWLSKKGITVEDSFLLDANSGTVNVQQKQGMFQIISSVKFPFLPIIAGFSDHPVTKGLEAVAMKFASPVSATKKDTLTRFTPLAFSSNKSGKVSPPVYFDFQRQFTDRDFPYQRIPVAGVLEKRLEENSWKLLVVGDGDFAVNGPPDNPMRLREDDVNFMVNSIDWLSDDTGLIELRTKGIAFRPLSAELKDGTKTLLKYLNFLLPIVLVAIYGLVKLQMNRSKRMRLIQENYE